MYKEQVIKGCIPLVMPKLRKMYRNIWYSNFVNLYKVAFSHMLCEVKIKDLSGEATLTAKIDSCHPSCIKFLPCANPSAYVRE